LPSPEAPHPLLNDRDGVLDAFYEALWRSEKREAGAITRVAHYGDSPTTGDLVTGDIRLLLQQRFGDAGHGFALIARPWAWYQRRNLAVWGEGWSIEPALHFNKRELVFGLGAINFSGGPSAMSRITLEGPPDHSVELWYQPRADGGEVVVRVDGAEI